MARTAEKTGELRIWLRSCKLKRSGQEKDYRSVGVKAQMADGMMHFVSEYAKLKEGDDPAQLQIVMGCYCAPQFRRFHYPGLRGVFAQG